MSDKQMLIKLLEKLGAEIKIVNIHKRHQPKATMMVYAQYKNIHLEWLFDKNEELLHVESI